MAFFKANTRTSQLRSCSVNLKDLRDLFSLLSIKLDEALKYELEQSPNEVKDRIRQLFKLGIFIKGSLGEAVVGDEIDILKDDNLPKNIIEIIFDSSYYFKFVTGQEPRNKFIIQFDFKKQNILDFSNPTIQPFQNNSSITVAGQNDTWVNGVYAEILGFLREKQRKRNWLHKKMAYDLYLYILFYPIAFWCIYRATEYFKRKIGTVLLIGICLYIFFAILFLLRILFNYARWMFPLTEIVPESGTKMGKHRAFLFSVIIGVVACFCYDVIKTLLSFKF